MNKQVLLGTNNKDKLRELSLLLGGAGVEVLSLKDFPNYKEAVEDGKTFESNARKKARHYAIHAKAVTLADDSGLMVSALNGRPGVYSARFAGENCTYDDNNVKLLRLLKKVPEKRRRAKFICVMALYDAKAKPVAIVKGECKGRIAFEKRGAKGFGYDPVFIPDRFLKTFAELTPEEKGKISHRGKALRKAQAEILKYFK